MSRKVYIKLLEKYLKNEISEEELQQLQYGYKNDRMLNALLDEKLENSDSEIDKDTANKLYNEIISRISIMPQSQKPKTINRNIFRWAMIFVLPILSALSVYFFMRDKDHSSVIIQPVTVSTGKGEKAEITLADGSHVWLNSGSSITYDNTFNHYDRQIKIKGEAYFEVAHDVKRPFIVKTDQMKIQALGTAFNVNAFDDESIVSSVLIRGKIKVSVIGKEFILNENERASFDKKNYRIITDKVCAQDYIAWKNGNIYFENQTFDEVVRALSRVFNVDIRFASEKLQPIRFSGTLGCNSIRNAMDILSLTSPMRYEMNGSTIVLYYRDYQD
jgi:ferric-dicitrate binding protein FerR (iron transport regulator)